MELSQFVDSVCRPLYEQLVILFHDHECAQCEGTDGVIQYSTLPLCHIVDAILSHMKYCRSGMTCQVPGCSSARIIVSHWKSCRKKECPFTFNLSKDRKRKTQLHLQEEIKSFSSVESTCHHLYNQLILQFCKHKCDMCAKIPYQHYSDLPLCHSVDTILSHMKYCRAGMSCEIPGCPDSRAIFSHWKACKQKDCPVVWNLRKDCKQNTLKRLHQKAILPSVMRVNRQTAKKYRQMLFLMYHSWTCMCRQEFGGIFCASDLPQCQSMQTLLKHTMSCEEEHRCKYPDCTIARFLFMHYMTCIRHECPICWPVRSVIKQLCGTKDCSTSRPFNKCWEGIPIAATSSSEDVTEPRFTVQTYRWLLAKDKPLIGPPLFQKQNPQKRGCTSRRWKKKSRIMCSWVRRHPYRWRHYISPRVQLQSRGIDPSAVPYPL
ncbi:uncharacterized protein RB166_015265 [Leptodactylus fuscus]